MTDPGQKNLRLTEDICERIEKVAEQRGLQRDDHQHIVFLEPHGPALEGDPLVNYRVQFHERIKKYKTELAEKTDRDDVSLHSYLISTTEVTKLIFRARVDDRQEFHDRGVYFEDDDFAEILSDVLSD